MYPTEKRANSAARKLDAHLPKPGTPEHDFHTKMNGIAGTASHVVKPMAVGKASKGFQLVTLDDCYALVTKGAGDPPAIGSRPAVPDVASRPKKYPRRLKPTVQMKPISDQEAMTRLSTGTHETAASRAKSLRWLAALKALAVGYGKTSGGGALRAANRGTPLDLELSVDDLSRAMGPGMAPPVGPAKPPKVYLPGVHNPKSPMRKQPGLKKTSGASKAPAHESRGAAVHKTFPAKPVAKGISVTTNFNDIFKSELGIPADEVLVDCPHCEAPITKSDLAKAAHGGKGATTHISGPKHGKSGAHVSEQNPDGGTMRGGSGHGVHASSRGVPGAQKVDDVHVQSVDRHKRKNAAAHQGNTPSKSIPRMAKAGCDDDDASSDDAGSGVEAEPVREVAKKSITVRGTDYVQYVDDGSDAALAKAISEGTLGGTSPTQPLDLNNDLTRLLV